MDFDFGMKRRRLVRLPSVVAAAGAILAATSSEAAAAACAAGTEVSTDRGWVCGVVTGNTTQWLGLPYAAPCAYPKVDPKRWHLWK